MNQFKSNSKYYVLETLRFKFKDLSRLLLKGAGSIVQETIQALVKKQVFSDLVMTVLHEFELIIFLSRRAKQLIKRY